MKKIVMFALLLLSISSYSQRAKVYVDNGAYQVEYSEVYRQPLKVVYFVECTEVKFSRAGLDFYTDKSILTSTSADYAHNEYDKGHMAPAAAFACDKQKLGLTFSYLNCALQNQYLNRGAWRLLESYERNLAKTTKVKTTILIEFKPGAKKLASGATVPTGFYKILEYGGKTERYYFPNEAPSKKRFSDYLMVNK